MLPISTITRTATFDSTGSYRYSLGRQWRDGGPLLAILMLNPSQASDTADDPTIRRCMGLAHGWRFGAIQVVNLFAYRTADPRQLKQTPDPIGPDNDAALITAAAQADRILLAWGNHGCFQERDEAVLALLSSYQAKWCCIDHNRTGQPRHPLYVRRDAGLTRWDQNL
ncbi:MAG: DUF1643 domain-containing protein [Nodosilinea sp.]